MGNQKNNKMRKMLGNKITSVKPRFLTSSFSNNNIQTRKLKRMYYSYVLKIYLDSL